MELTNDRSKVSYILGENIGKNFLVMGYDIDIDIFCQAIQDAFKGKSAVVIPDSEKKSLLSKWQADEDNRKKQKDAIRAIKIREEGKNFLTINRMKDGVQETKSGLQYKVQQHGNTEKPNAKSTVTVHYHGTLIDGTVFDSSIERGEPISFPLNQVIAGWTEGLQLMSKGAKYTFYIPDHLAYGEMEAGVIPPGSTLIFEVELIDIN